MESNLDRIRADMARIETWRDEVLRRVDAIALALVGSADGEDRETVARLRGELVILEARLTAMAETLTELQATLGRVGALSGVEEGRCAFIRWMRDAHRMEG